MTHPIHMLWAHPRSVSTAFERIMRERGDLHVLHEPLMYYHYLHRAERPFAGFEPEPGHPTSFHGIRDMMLDRARDRPVFAKDMAYYAPDEVLADTALLARMTHAFIVRDPAEAAVSYARLDPDFTVRELGLTAQLDLATRLRDRGIPVHVVLSETLRADPAGTMQAYWRFAGLPVMERALNWQARTPADWVSVKHWHGAVTSSTGIRPPDRNRDAEVELAALPARIRAIHAAHVPAYRALCKLAADQP